MSNKQQQQHEIFTLMPGDILVIKIIRGEDLIIADANDFKQRLKDFKLSSFRHLVEVSNEKVLPGGLVGGFLRTTTQMKTLNPIWNDEFQFEILNEMDNLLIHFYVYDWDRLTKDDPMGDVIFTLTKEDLYFLVNKPREYKLNLQNVETGNIIFEITILEGPLRLKSLSLQSYNSFLKHAPRGTLSNTKLSGLNISNNSNDTKNSDGWKELSELNNYPIEMEVPFEWDVSKYEIGTNEFDNLIIHLKLQPSYENNSKNTKPTIYINIEQFHHISINNENDNNLTINTTTSNDSNNNDTNNTTNNNDTNNSNNNSNSNSNNTFKKEEEEFIQKYILNEIDDKMKKSLNFEMYNNDFKQRLKDFKLSSFRHLVEVSNEKVLPGGLVGGFLRTTTQMKTLNPIWNDEFQFEILNEMDNLLIHFYVYDWDRLTKDDPMGDVIFTLTKEDLYFLVNKPREYKLNLQNVETGNIIFEITILEGPLRLKSLSLQSYNSFLKHAPRGTLSNTKLS
ncbi:predicted protein, partial [Naegleria gruberi]